MLIGIHGKIGHGKDTVANFIIKNNNRFVNRKFAYPLKKFCADLLGCNISDFESRQFKNSILPHEWDIDGKPITVREFMQRVGTEGGRMGVHPDIWVNAVLGGYHSYNHWIISDLRFPNEAERIRALGGYLVKVIRDELNTKSDNHSSENALDEFDKWDYIIYNNSDLESLSDTVDAMYDSIMKKSK